MQLKYFKDKGKMEKEEVRGKKMSQELLAPPLPSHSPLPVALKHPLKSSGFLRRRLIKHKHTKLNCSSKRQG